jgi:integrase
MSRTKPTKRVYLRHGRYYYVTPAGQWKPLTRESEGLPAMHIALGRVMESATTSELVPAVVARWLEEKAEDWGAATALDMVRVANKLAAEMVDLRPSDVTTALANRYLRLFRATPRTHNWHRTVLRGVMALAAREGLREGHNPVDDIPPMKLGKRTRIVTDAEIAAMKAAALQQSRNGEALVQMIDLAVLTGQRISDVLKMRWQDITDEGVLVVQGKTGAKLLIEWSPALRAAVDACAGERDRIGHLLKTQSGTGYRYAGIRSAWDRACVRAGIEDLNIHDLRGRAGVDALGAEEDIRAAQKLLGHAGEGMTRHYVEGKYAKRVKPSK